MYAEYDNKEYDRWISICDCSIQLILYGQLGGLLNSLVFKDTASTKHQKAWHSEM